MRKYLFLIAERVFEAPLNISHLLHQLEFMMHKYQQNVEATKKSDLLFVSMVMTLSHLHQSCHLSSYMPDWWFFFDCSSYAFQGSMSRKVIHSSWTNYNMYNPDDITLSVHLTLDRYEVLELMLSYWVGPVSAAIYVGPEHIDNITDFMDVTRKLLTRNNVDLHFVPKQGVSDFSLQ